MTTITDLVLARLVDAYAAANAAMPDTDDGRLNQVTVYDAEVPLVPTYRFVAVYPLDGGMRTVSGVAGTARDVTFNFQCTYVASRPNVAGSSRARAQWLATTGSDALIGYQFELDGFVLGPVQQVPLSIPANVDEKVADRPTVYFVSQYTIQADRL